VSYQASAWAVAQKCESGTEKAILLVLAAYIGADGTCYPGQDTLADQACCSVKSVERALKAFEDRGWIKRTVRRRRDGSRTSDLVSFTAMDHAEEHQPDTVSDSEPTRHPVRTNPTLCPNQPDTMSGLTTFEPVRGIGKEDSVPNGTDVGPSPDLDKRAWDEALVTLQRGGLNDKKARTFFGKLLKDNGLLARDLLPSLLNAQVTGTADPQAYLVRAASGVASRRPNPSAPASVPIELWDDDRWSGALALHRDEGWWSEGLGPPPGQPGCRVPAHLIERKAA
jgi:hypothetical protein